MCNCEKKSVTRRDVLRGVGAGAVAVAAYALAGAAATAQTEGPPPVVESEAVALPPVPSLPAEEMIVREVVLPDARQDNGYTPESREATPEMKAALAARDSYLATLPPDVQGDAAQLAAVLRPNADQQGESPK